MPEPAAKRFAIIGNPLGHSLSPALQERLLTQLGIKGSYVKLPITEPDLPLILRRLVENDFTGFNVTIPFKTAIMSHLDEIDETALAINAVNTVRLESGKLKGHNTDCAGFIRSLENQQVKLFGAQVVVLGAGGAARAALFGLIRAKVAGISLFNRSREKAEKLAQEADEKWCFPNITVNKWEPGKIRSRVQNAQLVVNTTPIGMWPNSSATPVKFDFPVKAITAMDMIYNPLRTQFLHKARLRGATTVDGLDMFIYQGVAAMQIWLDTEFKYDFRELKNFLITRLEAYGKH